MHIFAVKVILSLVTLWGMSIVTCTARGLEVLPLANLTKRAGEARTYVPPNFLMTDVKKVGFLGRDVDEPLEYLWSGAIVFESDGSKYQRCLRYIPSDKFPQHAPCKCTRIDKSKDCDDKSINHPTPSYRWIFDGSIRMFKRETRKISFWVGHIRHHASGKCLGYSPESSFPTYRGEESHTPGKIGDLDMVDCDEENPSPEGERYTGRRIWVVWLTEKDTKTSIIPWGATHMWPACSGTRVKAQKTILDRLKGKSILDRLKGKKVQWKRVYRGIAASPTSKGVYFGCAREEHTWLTPHPWFYRVPKDRGFFPDKKNFDDMGSAIDGEKNSIERLIDFDLPNTTPGNEVPADLEVEGVPQEEVAKALRGIYYETEEVIQFEGGDAPAFDDQISDIERENLVRQKGNLEREEAMRKTEEDENDDDDEFEDARDSWNGNPFSDDEDFKYRPPYNEDDENPPSNNKTTKDPPSDDKTVKDPPSNDKTVKDPSSNDEDDKDPPSDDDPENPFSDKHRVKEGPPKD